MTTRRFVQVLLMLLGLATRAAGQPPIGPIQAAGLRAVSAASSADARQPPPDDGWWRVEGLKPGAEIAVTDQHGISLERTFVSADADGITAVRVADSTVARYAKADVRTVTHLHAYRAGGGSTGAFLAGLSGAVLGGILASSVSHCYDVGCMPVGLSGMAIGATVGGVAGYHASGHAVDQVIYRAP
jgi:hypothetical protein